VPQSLLKDPRHVAAPDADGDDARDASAFVPVHAPTEFNDSPVSRAFEQPLLLGLFLPIQAGGWSASTLPRTTDWGFDYNLELVQRAEAFGFDLVFALSQWLPKGGYGGVFNGDALDSFMSLAAMTARTERIILVATSHVLYGPWHPLHFAKFTATLDHISKGRWGINVVTGHRAIEHEMFGWHRIEHDRRYELAGEFLDAVQQLWAQTENFSFAPALSSWKLDKAFVSPKPRYGRPLLVNATGSDAGIAFAARHSDVVFITSPAGPEIEAALAALPAHTARVKAAAAAQRSRTPTTLNGGNHGFRSTRFSAHVAGVSVRRRNSGMAGFRASGHRFSRSGRDAGERRHADLRGATGPAFAGVAARYQHGNPQHQRQDHRGAATLRRAVSPATVARHRMEHQRG
jgi:FMNH2-dependent dimethyl sulfone monooxygenase